MKIQINLEKYFVKCTYASKMLNSVIERPIDWGVSKLKVMRKHNETFRKLHRFTERLPEGWKDIALDVIAAGEIFTNPYRIKRYLNKDRNNLDTESVKFIRLFQDNPWFYTVFSIKEKLKQYGNVEQEKGGAAESLNENFFRIID